MVGLMNTKLGIFKIDVTKDRNIYSLKDAYKKTVKVLLDKTVVT